MNQIINLGLVKAIFVGLTPPVNTNIIWYDDNVGEKKHKVYDTNTLTWVDLGGGGGTTLFVRNNGVDIPSRTYLNFASGLEAVDDGAGLDQISVSLDKFDQKSLDLNVNLDDFAEDSFSGFTEFPTSETDTFEFNIDQIDSATYKVRIGNGDYEDITFTNLVNFAIGAFTTPNNSYTVTSSTKWDIMVIAAIDINFEDEARVLINYKYL